MKHAQKNLAALALGLVALSSPPLLVQAGESEQKAANCQGFDTLAMHLERNVTDEDGEVVLLAKTVSEGLRSLNIIAPGGRELAEFEMSRKTIGIREFILESPEPADLGEVLKSYPAGAYQIRGRTISGVCIKGSATLSHTEVQVTEIVSPAEDDVVDLNNFVITWLAVPAAVSYIIAIDNETTGTTLNAESPSSATSFAVPADWLEPDNEYTVSVAVKIANGNVSSVEIPVTTAP